MTLIDDNDTDPLTLEQFVRALPKVELHCHLFGAVRRQTFSELSARAGHPLSPADIDAFYTRGEKPVGVLRVLRALDAALIRQPDDLYRITYEYLQDAHAHGVAYSEFFWNPTGTVRVSGIAYAAAQEAIVRAIVDAQRDLGILGRLIPSIDREASPDEALALVQWMLAQRVPQVVGIGMDYRENDRPPELFEAAYRAAREAGLKTTAHAGEFGMPWNNVATAIDLLQVDRIDHGYTIVDNPALLQRCIERGLVFTVVPTNSYYLRTLAPERWALDHPIRQMLAAGLRLHPNTDDPTLHLVTPTGAWLMMLQLGASLDDLHSFMLNGLDAAWMDEALRQRWRVQWSQRFARLRARLQS
ncbi:adenosine deaminase family protein [Herbaspirillum rubrisubalbicans]|uniref:adenosine deaminase family protein n=1 Tax=Herbaspirillum rubrisubalbicans TaxID=80842 RepID=UPI0015C58080|nr:adenosine deaminase [Herbaspirillum rubrisubalbicans]NQE50648.1 adenosine deaminase [Herbaspirillum rubrisubalbicans]